MLYNYELRFKRYQNCKTPQTCAVPMQHFSNEDIFTLNTYLCSQKHSVQSYEIFIDI